MMEDIEVTDQDVEKLSHWSWKRLGRYMDIVRAQMELPKARTDEAVMLRLQTRESLCTEARMKKLDRGDA